MLCEKCDKYNPATQRCWHDGKHVGETAPKSCVDFIEMRGAMLTDAESEVYFCAFRYCLGRMSYIVSAYCTELKHKLPRIRTRYLELMAKEIKEAKESDELAPRKDFVGRLGMECDKADWMRALASIEAELVSRKNKEEENGKEPEECDGL